MPILRRNLNIKATNCWTREVLNINSNIVCLYSDIVKHGVGLNWSDLNTRTRHLMKTFYFHCLDYVTLEYLGQLFEYGKNYCFEHCTLQTLLLFQELFPTFPSRFEWQQCYDIIEIINLLLNNYLLQPGERTRVIL